MFDLRARAFLFAMVSAAACASAVGENLAALSVDEVAQRLAEKKVRAFDCNPKDVYQDGHVPGAKWVDYKNVAASDLPADKSAPLVFYCANEM